MKSAPENKLLIRILGIEFYRKHAGFFFGLLFLAFGLLRGEEHYYLMLAAVGSLPLLGAYLLLWFLYWLLCMYNSWQILRQRQYQFLYLFRLYPLRRKIIGFSLATGLQFLPVLLYAGTMAAVGLHQQRWLSFFLCVFLPLLLWSSSIFLHLVMLRANCDISPMGKIPQTLPRWRKPLFTLPLLHLFHHYKFSFFLGKLASILLLLGIAYLYRGASYDSRFAFLAVILAGGCNTVLIYYIHNFQQQLTLLRNLPLSLSQRFLQNMLLFVLLIFPEVIIAFRYFHLFLEPIALIMMVLLLLSFLSLLHAYLLIRPLQKEAFLWHCSGIMLLHYLIIIFGIPVWGIIGLNLLGGLVLFYHNFHRFDSSE